MSNVFDQFDAGGAAKAANVFDQFDHPTVAASTAPPTGFAAMAPLGMAASAWNYAPQSPTALSDVALPAGGAAAGQAIGALAPPPYDLATIPIGGAIGGGLGEYGAQRLKGDDIKWGKVFGSGLLGAMPGASMAKAGVGEVTMQAAKYAAAGALAKTAETGIDEQRLPTPGELAIAVTSGAVSAPIQKIAEGGGNAIKSLYPVRDETIQMMKDAGYIIPPSMVNARPGMKSSMVNRALESAAGKADLKATFSQENQNVTNSLIKQRFGIPDDVPISEQSLQQVRNVANKPYEEIAAIAPEAADDLKQLQLTRETAHLYQKQLGRGEGNLVDARDGLNAANKKADQLEATLEQWAVSADKPDLVNQMREARKVIAQTYLVQRNLYTSTGDVSAKGLAAAFGKTGGAPLTDELATIGRSAEAFPDVMGDAPKMKAPGVSKAKIIESLGAAAIGAHTAGPAGLMAGVAPFYDVAAGHAVASPLYQRLMAVPNYGTPRPDLLAQLARFGSQYTGQQPSPQALQSLSQPQ